MKTMFQILKETGLPVAEVEFPDNWEGSPPFIIYEHRRSQNFYADNRTYFGQMVLDITLVCNGSRPDKAAKSALEAALNANGVLYQMMDAYPVQQENTYEINYEIGVVP